VLNTIERLREKPEAYRKRIAFIVATSIAGVIFLIWLSVLGVRLGSDKKAVKEEEKAGLFAEVKQGFSGIFETGKEHFDNTKSELEDIFPQQP